MINPFLYYRKIIVAIVFLVALVFLCSRTTLAQDEGDMNEACAWQGVIGSHVERAYMFAWADMWHTYAIPDEQLQSILELDVSDNFWVFSSDYGYFDTPEDETAQLLVLVFFTEQGKRKIYFTSAFSTPETYYAYLFLNLKPYATADGRYYGIHPCRVFRVDADIIHAYWYAAELIE